MLRKLIITAAALAIAAPAAATSIRVDYDDSTAIPSNNDFRSRPGANNDLNDLGLFSYTTTGASLTLSNAARITFYLIASESGFSDTFTATGAGAPVSYTENSGFTDAFASPILIGTQTYLSGGSLAGALNFTSSLGAPGTVGDAPFGIFLSRGQESGDSLTTLYFGYDDQINNADDNHDDFILMAVVSAVPEPATWAMMIAGFGMVGGAMRRRRSGSLALA